MADKSQDRRSALRKLREWASGGPPNRPSLFHFVEEEPQRSSLSDLDWSFLRHPIRSFREEWKAPRTRASLFRYLEAKDESAPINWKDFIKDLFTEYRFSNFIPR